MQDPEPNAQSLFAKGIEIPPGPARDAFVTEACADSPALRQELESLLAAYEGSGDFLADDAPPRLPGYRIEHKIGEGSLGRVYAAHDEKLNRRVALKVLRSTGAESVRRRVLDEASKAAALSDPAIVTIFSVLDDTNPPAIVMEWVEGFPLDRFAAELSFHQKAGLLREVARGLAVAHSRGLVHRDLKPDNIIVGPDMRPRILDFGLALLPGESAGPKGFFAGTPLYASPEQVACRPLTPASDIFSFGSLMFTVLTGRPPFTGATPQDLMQSIASTSPPFLREVATGVPEDLQAVCLACLAFSAADRPTAADIVLDLGRFLIGEPVRLRPKLYDDLLRRRISEYATQARSWESQNVISHEESDAMQGLHRRLLADDDHWIIDARRVTLLQTILSGGTWLTVVATVLTVWLLRAELSPWGRWLIPLGFTLTLLAAGCIALRRRDDLVAATFLAGAALATAPCSLALLAHANLLGTPQPNVTQLFEGVFTNQQVLFACATAAVLSAFGLWRLKMTGFAWTTATLGTATYVAILLLFNWLDKEPEIKALWCLPLAAAELFALHLERQGRVRWTLPFHLVALLAALGGLNVMAANGPTLQMLGLKPGDWGYFDHGRLQAFSVVLNGGLFLSLTLLFERARSLDLRRAAKLFEIVAMLHVLSALFSNALEHRKAAYVRVDVWLYVGSALLLVALAALRSRWRILVGGLAGCGLGSYLLVEFDLVARRPFIIGLGVSALLCALAAFLYVETRQGSGPRRALQRKPVEVPSLAATQSIPTHRDP
jgi:serine/threonine protein kinase